MHEVIHPANPFAETEFYYMVSTSVGSGKTVAAVRMITEGVTEASHNFIYVAPTIKLAEQTAQQLKEANGGIDRNIHLIHAGRDAGATKKAIGTIGNTSPNMGVVVIITTKTFLSIMSTIGYKKYWTVVLDEAFQPLDLLEFKSEGYMDLCMDLFDVDEDDRVKAAAGRGALVQRIATGNFKDEQAYNNESIRAVCEKVANPAIYCEWVKQTPKYVQMSAYVEPRAFRGFQEVYFLSALFEQSILYHLWTRQHGVEFHESETFKEDKGIINIHRDQGHLVRVGHLMHPEDKASKYDLQRNYKSGVSYEQTEGLRVIDRALELVLEYFKGSKFIYQANNWYKARWDLPEDAVRVGVWVHGQNNYKHHINAVALAVTNPQTAVVDWLMLRTGLSQEDVYLAHRIHTVYQFFGRTGIRQRGDERTKTLLTVGREDAEFIHRLFEGSTFLGQIGDLECMADKGKVRRQDWLNRSIGENPEYRKLRKVYKNVAKKVKRGTAEASELVAVKASIAGLKVRLRAELEAA